MQTSVVVVGAGPGGLAMSHHLTRAGLDHVLLERGTVAHSWRTERWDSLRLLTPNWMTSLPGASYKGDDPDGYMTAAETVATLENYSRAIDPPLHTGVEVESACYVGERLRGAHDRRNLALRRGRRGYGRIERASSPGLCVGRPAGE